MNARRNALIVGAAAVGSIALWSPAGQAAGGTETQSVNVTDASYVAVLEKDDNGNWGHLASAVVPPTHRQSAPSIDSSLVPAFKECGTPARQPTEQHAPPVGAWSLALASALQPWRSFCSSDSGISVGESR